MGKIKVKRKSTLIDMTAMSDVTVLLLTFFMLTSTFLQKEPTQVITPPSVSEEKVEISNVVQVLVANEQVETPNGKLAEGDGIKVFLTITGEADPDVADGAWGSEPLRATVFKNAMYRLFLSHGIDINSNPQLLSAVNKDAEKFAKQSAFGVPYDKMHEFLNLKQSDQDAWISDMTRKDTGIPTVIYTDASTKRPTSEFQIWMDAIRAGGNENLTEAMRKSGSGIAVKADQTTEFAKVNEVLEQLRAIKLNKFTVMTALKTEND